MSALLWVVGAAVLMALLAFARGTFELRKNTTQAQLSLSKLRAEGVEALASEGRAVLRDRLGVTLPDDLAEAAEVVDRMVRSPRIKEAFARPDFYWYFVQPLGALVGELIRQHGQGHWVDDPSEGLILRVKLPDGRELTSRPFDRVIRHRLSGRPGELRAYLLFASGQSTALAAQPG